MTKNNSCNQLKYYMKAKFKLTCKAGVYEADTFYALVIQVLKHRFWHLRTHGKWID